MAGTLVIPNDIGAQSGPDISASLFDENWDAIADYVNARQVTFGLIANRPAAGVAGRYYYATDQSTYYLDNATSWLTVAGGGAGGNTSPLPGSINQSGAYQSGDPNKFDLAADRVMVTALAGATAHYLSSVSKTVDLSLTGAGGRDQAAALSASSWAYIYYIYNATTATVNLLVSASAWPSASPTLPSGYTECALAGAVYLDGSGQFSAMRIRNRRSIWLAQQAALTNGTASTATVVSLASIVPPNALWVEGWATMKNSVAATGPEYVYGEVSMDTGGTPLPLVKLSYSIDTTYAGSAGGAFGGYPVSQNLYYKIVDAGGSAADGTNQLSIAITAFENPNGG